MSAPVALAPEFIGVLRYLLNAPENRANLSMKSREEFYRIIGSPAMSDSLPGYDTALEEDVKAEMDRYAIAQMGALCQKLFSR